MIATDTFTARSLCSTLANIATPCSLNTRGNVRRPPRPFFEVPDWNFKAANSSYVRVKEIGMSSENNVAQNQQAPHGRGKTKQTDEAVS